MGRITLNYSLWYHQNQFYKVEKGQSIMLTHDELSDLFEAKRIYRQGICVKAKPYLIKLPKPPKNVNSPFFT